MTAITGNTFPVRVELKQMGGQWNAADKAWMVPDSVADLARAAVAGQPERVAYSGRRGGSRRVSNYARFSSGEVVYTNRRGRCIDAPCCGCCS